MRGAWLTIAIASWLAATGGGFVALTAYAAMPGERAAPPARWPAVEGVSLAPGRWTLVFFAHPQCPCTRASLGELERLLARVGDSVAASIVFLAPPEEGAAFLESRTVYRARALGQVRVVLDANGSIARAFGAATSGQVVLFDAGGLERFAGGITPARGHMGDNAGSARIEALVEGASALGESAVFGCPLD